MSRRYRSIESLQRDNRRCRACVEAGFHLEESVNARGWSGIHFRHADTAGAQIGREVARARRYHRLLRPLHH